MTIESGLLILINNIKLKRFNILITNWHINEEKTYVWFSCVVATIFANVVMNPDKFSVRAATYINGLRAAIMASVTRNECQLRHTCWLIKQLLITICWCKRVWIRIITYIPTEVQRIKDLDRSKEARTSSKFQISIRRYDKMINITSKFAFQLCQNNQQILCQTMYK